MAERMIIEQDPAQKRFFDGIHSIAPFDSQLAKAIDFTVLEDDCLAEWLEAVLRGRLDIARRLLREGLMAEHYRSLLPDVLDENDQASAEQRRVLLALRERFLKVREEFRARDQDGDNAVVRFDGERPNAP